MSGRKGMAMKKIVLIISCFLLINVATGCVTLYKTAADVRDVKTIASDTRIKAAIVKAYVDDESIKALDIFTACYEGDVYLVGEYEKASQKERAIDIARSVKGVKSVTTFMLPKKEDDPCADLKIAAKIKGRLLKDQDIWATNVDVKSVQCNVVLVGLVGSRLEVTKSLEHARSVEGVKSVKSFLKSAE